MFCLHLSPFWLKPKAQVQAVLDQINCLAWLGTLRLFMSIIVHSAESLLIAGAFIALAVILLAFLTVTFARRCLRRSSKKSRIVSLPSGLRVTVHYG
jgi:small-conductance mechanosensitive channel